MITIFSVIDIIATILIGLFAILAPNLHVIAFKKEPTIVVLIIVVVVMITLSARPLIQKQTLTLPRLFIAAAITMFFLYTIYSFSKWYLYHPEGSYSFRFLSIAKKLPWMKN